MQRAGPGPEPPRSTRPFYVSPLCSFALCFLRLYLKGKEIGRYKFEVRSTGARFWRVWLSRSLYVVIKEMRMENCSFALYFFEIEF